jgi:lipoprotein-releasing system permease protein
LEERTVALSGVIIGRTLAQQLGVILGDPINVVSPLNNTPGPMGLVPKVKRFVVAALFDSGMFTYDEGLMMMSLTDAQNFFGLGDRVTGIEVRVRDVYAAQTIARQLEAALGFPFKARDWTESQRNLFAALALEKYVYFIVLLLIILVAAFNIIATLIMVVMEKRKGDEPLDRLHLCLQGGDHRCDRYVIRHRAGLRRLLALGALPVH